MASDTIDRSNPLCLDLGMGTLFFISVHLHSTWWLRALRTSGVALETWDRHKLAPKLAKTTMAWSLSMKILTGAGRSPEVARWSSIRNEWTICMSGPHLLRHGFDQTRLVEGQRSISRPFGQDNSGARFLGSHFTACFPWRCQKYRWRNDTPPRVKYKHARTPMASLSRHTTVERISMQHRQP